jgi:hypothetical protein
MVMTLVAQPENDGWLGAVLQIIKMLFKGILPLTQSFHCFFSGLYMLLSILFLLSRFWEFNFSFKVKNVETMEHFIYEKS